MLITLGLGLAVGAIMALTGAGGGILAVPALIFGAHLNVAQASPIGLLAVGMAAGLGAVIGLKDRVVRYRAALLMAGMGIVLAPAGVWLASRTDNRWLSILFALVLLFVAYRNIFGGKAGDAADDPELASLPCRRRTDTGRFNWTARCARVLTMSGGVAGLLSGLLGVGGGFVMVPALKRYTDLPMPSVIATSLAVIALVSVSGVAANVAAGNLMWAVALPFSAGALAGMIGGRMASTRLHAHHLQKAFGAVSAMVALGMIVKSVA